MEKHSLLIAACLVILSGWSQSVGASALQGRTKRDIWALYDKTEDGLLVQLQRTMTQKRQNGYWMLQYKCLDSCQPSDWTDTKPAFSRWDNLWEHVRMTNGKMEQFKGTVRLAGLVSGNTYGLRTIYSLLPDGTGGQYEPSTNKHPNGRTFTL